MAEHRPPAIASRATSDGRSGTSCVTPPVMEVGSIETSLDRVPPCFLLVARESVARRHAYRVLLAWRAARVKDGRALLGREEREQSVDHTRVSGRGGQLGRPRQRGLDAADAAPVAWCGCGGRGRAARLLSRSDSGGAPLAEHQSRARGPKHEHVAGRPCRRSVAILSRHGLLRPRCLRHLQS
eukprot:scaffold57305_cov50-Phaeocystis_antarctica.AAC.5